MINRGTEINLKSVNLARAAGAVMLSVFGINVYIGIYDTSLAQFSPMHAQLNWVIAAADLIAAVLLFVKPRRIWKTLAGIVWPIAYVGSLFLDVETRLCLGASPTSCFPSTTDAYNYLILGSSAEQWVLWPYTIRFAIALAIVVQVLTASSLYFRTPKATPKTIAVSKEPEKLS
jgi:hypothetical protein